MSFALLENYDTANSGGFARISPERQTALIRLQCFLDAGYQLDVAVKLANGNPGEFPAPPGKSRTPIELMAAFEHTNEALTAFGLTLNNASDFQAQRRAPSAAPAPAASVVIMDRRSGMPNCTVGRCTNMAITKCQYPVDCCEEPCSILVCMTHGQNIRVRHCLVTVCPPHATESISCAIM